MNARRVATVAVPALAALATLVALGAWALLPGGAPEVPHLPPEVRAALLPQPLPLDGFALRDQDGAPFGPERLRGGWTLVFQGYTSCPDVCPLTLHLLGRMVETVRREAGDAAVPAIVLMTADPARDSPARLKAYLEGFSGPFVGVTGSDAELERLETQLGAFHKVGKVNPRLPNPAAPAGHSHGPGTPAHDHGHAQDKAHGHDTAPHAHGGYLVTHSAEVYVVDPQGRLFAKLRPPIEPMPWAHTVLGILAAYDAASSAATRGTATRSG
jgi:protein SCO1/2